MFQAYPKDGASLFCFRKRYKRATTHLLLFVTPLGRRCATDYVTGTRRGRVTGRTRVRPIPVSSKDVDALHLSSFVQLLALEKKMGRRLIRHLGPFAATGAFGRPCSEIQ